MIIECSTKNCTLWKSFLKKERVTGAMIGMMGQWTIWTTILATVTISQIGNNKSPTLSRFLRVTVKAVTLLFFILKRYT